jgi:hypothetical protein
MKGDITAVVLGLLILGIFILYLIAILHLLKNVPEGSEKNKWLLLIFFLPVAGSIYYLFVKKRKRTGTKLRRLDPIEGKNYE